VCVYYVVIHRGIYQFQGDDNGHVGRPCEVSLAPSYREPFASYGTSAVTRTRAEDMCQKRKPMSSK